MRCAGWLVGWLVIYFQLMDRWSMCMAVDYSFNCMIMHNRNHFLWCNIHNLHAQFRLILFATGKQQEQKVFTLQTIAPMAEQGLVSGCAVILPALGYQKKVGNNDLPQGALPTQNTLP